MAKNTQAFWEKKTLREMNRQEWESLCDGCGLCCLNKVEDEENGDVFVTNVHCKLFNPKTCQCSNYAKRKRYVPDCVVLTPKRAESLTWLPKTCAYRLLADGEDLPAWHPLRTGRPDRVHKAGISAKRMKLISEENVKNLEDHIEIKL